MDTWRRLASSLAGIFRAIFSCNQSDSGQGFNLDSMSISSSGGAEAADSTSISLPGRFGDKYQLVKELDGVNSTLCVGVIKASGGSVIVKEVILGTSWSRLSDPIEVEILRSLRSVGGVVGFLDWYPSVNGYRIVMER